MSDVAYAAMGLWAIQPDALAPALEKLKAQQARNPKLALEHGEPLRPGAYSFATIRDGVAIVPVRGPLLRLFNPWFWSYEEIAGDIGAALRDDRVKGILLEIDSPGGLAAGADEAAAAVREAAGKKPLTAYVGSMAASAGFYVGAGASELVAGRASVIGSVGSLIRYIDATGFIEKMGGKIIEIVATQSPNKSLKPGSPEERTELQAIVDEGAEAFIQDLASYRGVSRDHVMEHFGQGLVFPASQALAAGMIDRIGSFESVLAELAGRRSSTATGPASAAAPAHTETVSMPLEWKDVTAAGLREHCPALVKDIETAAASAASEQARTEASAAERARFAEMEALCLPGYEADMHAAFAAGKSPTEFGKDMVAKERGTGESHLQERRAAESDAAKPPAAAAPAAPAAAGGSVADQAKAEWEANKADCQSDFVSVEDFVAYREAEAAGKVRRLRAAS